ncbi:MAG: pyridoxal phosphate-dependent aminotransferase [Ethanoligenens sp.]
MKPEADLFAGAHRLEDMSISLIRIVMDKAKAMADAGAPVVPFVAGEPNFNTPEPIKEAAIQAILENHTHYTSNRGLPALRACIARQMQADTGLRYDPETEIVVTSGGAEAINNALIAMLDPGDEVIVFSPAFINYENVARICGASVIHIPLKKENDFQIDVDEVRARLTPKTKMIVMNNPCNPTGVLYTKETLEQFSKLIVENNLLAFSDEIYSRLTYDGQSFYSLVSFPGMRERTIVMNGFSKTYAMTGWRIGYLCADKRMMPHMMKVHQYSTTCSPTFIQVGLAKAMEAPETKRAVDDMVAAFAQRRRLILDGLHTIPQLDFVTPRGAFYVFVDVSGTGLSGEEFSNRLLEKTYVATVPGIGLGKECVDFVRFSYATSDENIIEGIKRLRTFTAEL